ncbi:hypothetical protein C8A00DRAFT_38672 [Chaetomidium leptoderma]|uniref:BHLH domain-containing protein n=1 Tax=Chaetomidium leptoderma TaxID=669021 RepID=A0AAN6VC78_9PEZI|nr:hypothetical protein C8A00DRAFT_38672 [Chaetomidium leptoderma]
MQSAATGRRTYSPDFGAESSFPERHLDDDKAVFPGIRPDSHQSTVTKRQVSAPSSAPLGSQGWPTTQNGPFLDYSHIHSHGPLVGSNAIPAAFPQTTASLQGEWASFREQSHGGLFWQSTHSELNNAEDDSDSIQSPADSLEEFCPPLPTLSTTQKPRRRSTHRVTKLARTSAPVPTHHPAARSERPYIPDFDYNTDWLDPSDLTAAFLPQPNYDNNVNNGGEIEITYRDSSSSSKVDSKRIAHKLSEKSRRNRLTVAIREIQKLLPSEGDGEDKPASQSQQEPDFMVRPGVPSSKLDVVEMAVGFIKDLKEKNKETARRLKEVQKEVDECRCQRGRGQAAAESGSSSPSTIMEDAAG